MLCWSMVSGKRGLKPKRKIRKPWKIYKDWKKWSGSHNLPQFSPFFCFVSVVHAIHFFFLQDINEGKKLEQLEEEEDDIEEMTLKQLREKRLAEMKKNAETHKYGDYKSIDQQTWTAEVTTGDLLLPTLAPCLACAHRLLLSSLSYSWTVRCGLFVCLRKRRVHKTEQVHSNTPVSLSPLWVWWYFLCRLLEEVAKKFKAVKFVKIISREAIPNYPDESTPTVLIYTKVTLLVKYFFVLILVASYRSGRFVPANCRPV